MTGALRQVLEGHTEAVRFVTFSSDGRWLASVADDGTVRVWDTTTGALLETLNDQSDCVPSITFSSDNLQIITGCGAYKLNSSVSQPAPTFNFLGCGVLHWGSRFLQQAMEIIGIVSHHLVVAFELILFADVFVEYP